MPRHGLKMMGATAILMFLMASLPVLAAPEDEGDKPEEKPKEKVTPKKGISPAWQRCFTNSDCVVLNFPCVTGAVNKKYETQAGEYYFKLSTHGTCESSNRRKSVTPGLCREQRCTWKGSALR